MAPSYRRSALLAAAALLAAPAAASATPTATYDNLTGTLRVAGSTTGAGLLTIDRDGSVITIDGTMGVKAGTGCKQAAKLTCTTTLALKHVVVNLGDADDVLSLPPGTELTSGDDTVQLSSDLMPRVAGLISGDATILTGDGDDDVSAGGAGYGMVVYGGPGSDSITTGDGADVIYGEAGGDTIAAGKGADQVFGGAGNDVFETTDGDGADLWDAGTDTPSDSDPDAGDLIDYSTRTTAITAVLPSDLLNIPLAGNGAPGENDRLVHIENVAGGSGSNTLVGNERANVLTGRAGNDTISGGGGNDVLHGGLGADSLDGGSGNDLVDARRVSASDGEPEDRDTALDCGAGDDTVIRDYEDPATGGCEHDELGFRFRAATFTGSFNVGQTISLGQVDTFGDPASVRTTWFSCSAEGDDCDELGQGDSLVLTEALLGRVIFTTTTTGVLGAAAFDAVSSPLSGPVGPALPAPATPTPAPAPETALTSGGAAATRGAAPATFSEASAPRAQAVVGIPVRVAPSIDLGEGIATFEPEAFHQDSVLVSFNKGGATKILGISCAGGCTVTVAQTAVEAPVPGKASKSKKPKGVGLKSQTLAVAPGTAGAVVFTANAAQREAIGKLKKPRLQVTITVKDAAGVSHTATKLYVLKSYAKKG